MSKKIYDWKRFWCPRNAQIDLGDRGYLVDPESNWGHYSNPELVGLDAIADTRCLILLGEPGIGKSRAMESELSAVISSQIDAKRHLILDLHSYGSEDRLIRNLFESSEFRAWVDGDYALSVFLDSLDECLLRLDNVTALLAEEFKRYQDKSERLFLRIACRTAVWQSTFEEQLKQIWGENEVKIYELAPLRQVDVRHAAECEDIKEPDLLMQEILEKKVTPLAIKPVTLGFLLNIYRRDGKFSGDQTLVGLYLEGCRILCDEEDSSDLRLPGRRGNIELDQRLMIAARIAAVTVFANRDAIWTGRDRGQTPADDVLRQELSRGYERANERQFEANEAAIIEVLNTGLFSSRGSNRMGWAHQTYAEFLAAWYLKQHNLSLSQILSLILHPDGRVIPQLQETVAWLASMRSDVFQEVMKTDPDVLLQSDITNIDDEIKAKLVESLLILHHEEKLEYSVLRHYNNLQHPGIAEQLKSYICDSTRGQWSRLVAIDIAQDCNVKAVQDSLADIALAPVQLYIVRKHAAHVVCVIGDEKTKARLKPLAVGEAGGDSDDDLKGYALQAVWSKHISVKDLLDHLSQPKQKGAFPIIGGVYQDFIATEFAERLRLPDLPVTLKWLEQLPQRYDLHYPFRELADSVMLKAWQNLHEPGVLEAFASVAILRLKQHGGILGDRPHREYTRESFDITRDDDVEPLLRNSDGKRRQLIETIVLLISESESDFLWLIDIICSEDVLWIIERITSTEFPRMADVWVKLLRQVLSWHNLYWKNTNHIDAILEARSVSPAMQIEFEIEIELGSEKAKQAQATYLKYQTPLNPSEPEPTLDPPPKQRVLAALEKVEAGQPQLWWQIVVEMTLMPTSKEYIHDYVFESDITRLVGWKEAETNTKARIVKTARKYLDAGDPETKKWLGTDNFSHPPFAGYQALYLLVKQEPEFISKISTDIWTTWIPAILKSINFTHRHRKNKEDEVCRGIMRTAYRNAPDELIEIVISLMVHKNYEPRTFYPDDIYQLTNELLDQCLASLIIGRVPDESLNAGMLEILLTDLFKHDVDRAKEIAKSFLSEKVPESGESRNKAIVAARLLTTYPDNPSWSVFWSALQQDHKFGREVLESIAFQAARHGQIEQKIREDYLASLYIFLTHQYPEVERTELETQPLRGVEAQILGKFDDVRMWKNYIPQRLQARGTSEACDALRRIIRELPECREQLQPRLLEAENLARRNTWKPPKPEEILQQILIQDPSNLELSNQIETINRRTKQMADEPKIDQSVHVTGSKIRGDINTGNNNNLGKTDSKTEGGFDWKYWLSVGITVAVALVSVAASGVFNDEIKRLFNSTKSSPQTEQKLEKKIN
ncbi:NACHT domain-containing protein [Leptolyngbya sp. AN03gr2]|uniref:NACHT domain-containing protein n=1 Tax=unclassified Leptolyngbya TaxID=2650499 RepID=UPI003D323CD7